MRPNQINSVAIAQTGEGVLTKLRLASMNVNSAYVKPGFLVVAGSSDKIKMVSATAATGGSTTVRAHWKPLRQARERRCQQQHCIHNSRHHREACALVCFDPKLQRHKHRHEFLPGT